MALILVVDDESEINDFVAHTLHLQNYQVARAHDGETALRLIAERNPDLVLLDIMMPGISGYEVAERLKAEPATAHIPIIFVSARCEPEDQARGLEVAVDYICKPFSVMDFITRVRRVLQPWRDNRA